MATKIVSFDFDHTLTFQVSAIEHFSEKIGAVDLVGDMERKFRFEGLSTTSFSDETAKLFAGLGIDELDRHMSDLPLVPGSAVLIDRLRHWGIDVIINSVGYQSLIAAAARNLGISTVSGAKLGIQDGKHTGDIEEYFDEQDKITFVAEYAMKRGVSLSEVMAVGDGRSDIPLFGAVGASVALNADQDARSCASVELDSVDLRHELDFWERIVRA